MSSRRGLITAEFGEFEMALPALVAASLGLLPLRAEAQPQPCQRGQEREIVLTGARDESPAVVYGAADEPLMLQFDAPLRMDEGRAAAPGLDIRPHPYLPDALILTPSKALAAQGSAVVQVSLAGWVMVLTLAFTPERSDRLVRILWRPATSQTGVMEAERELREALRIATVAVLGRTPQAPHPEGQEQSPDALKHLVYTSGAYTYAQIEAQANSRCVPVEARLRRGQELIKVLVSGPVSPCARKEKCRMALVVQTALLGETNLLAVELLSKDGLTCETAEVPLTPGASGVP
jgi:hypothetical protein